MRTILLQKKIMIYVVTLMLISLAVSEKVFSSDKQLLESSGTIQMIRENKIYLQTNQNDEVWIYLNKSEELKIGDVIRVVYYSIADSENIFAAEEIEVLQSN